MQIEQTYDDGWVSPATVGLADLAELGDLTELADLPFEDDPVPPFDPYAVDERDPLDRAVAELVRNDRGMARALRALAEAWPRDGLSVRRQVGLLAGATGADAGFLDRAVEVLRAMPRTQSAFDDGLLSWSQVRGIVGEARGLSVAQRGVLDEALVGTVAQGRMRGEPDRVVEVCGDLAARIDVDGQERLEAAQERSERLVLMPDFDGWADVHGTLSPVTAATVAEALDAAADAPVAPDATPTDDDGKPLPLMVRPRVSRAAQWAQALERVCATYLGGCGDGTTSGRARPRVHVIAPLADLLDGEGDAGGVGSVAARLLWRRGNGRRRITRALVQRLAEDATIVPIFTDDDGLPVAIGDSYDPISPALRRAVLARDQGCRLPGCATPAGHCDLHHVIPRRDGGATSIDNLIAVCRPDHGRLDLHGWQLTLHADATLTVTIGRRTFTTRPRLPAPPTDPAPPAGAPDDRDGRQPGRPDQPVAN